MKGPHWFTLLVRAIGLLVLGMTIPHVGTAVSTLAIFFEPMFGAGAGTAKSYYTIVAVGTAGSTAASLAFAVYLLAGAPHIVRYCLRGADGRCPRCDYSLAGSPDHCPECGWSDQSDGARPATSPSAVKGNDNSADTSG